MRHPGGPSRTTLFTDGALHLLLERHPHFPSSWLTLSTPALTQNNEIKYFNLDDSLSCSLADPTMKQLLELKLEQELSLKLKLEPKQEATGAAAAPAAEK